MERNFVILKSFKDAFSAQLSDDPNELKILGGTTYGHESLLIAVLRPTDSSMVKKAILLAQEVGAMLAPISKGKNWGWGSCAPHVDGVILLDLSSMRKIIDYSDELGYITIEPGVSVSDVVNYLDERNSSRVLPMGGTSPQASLVGHMCERGISVGTLYHDRASHVCGLEAVLGDGRVVHTGMRRYAQDALSATHRWGPGPSMESLLTQSDMAIVTEATIWLPTGSNDSFLVFAASDDLAGMVNAFRVCESQGLRVATQIYNRAKVEKLFFGRVRPAGLTLPPGDWIAMAPVYPSSHLHAEADKQFIAESLKSVAGCAMMCLPLDDSFGPFNCRPYASDDVLLGMLYQWGEKQLGEGVDPQRDECGILWGCFAAPLLGDYLERACEIIDHVISQHDLGVYQAIHSISERACLLFPQLSFPKERAVDAEKALNVLSQELFSAGFPPYRLPALMGGVPASRDDHDQVIEDICRVLNPQGVIAKGKYSTPKPFS